ncbi:MAG TPA: roadblock/LC7 domain-containing protein [Candidatus Angelobacter sp.]|nr:roadblock/LC7 domain-containing protein [Candidatus Angelobacter sp.]
MPTLPQIIEEDVQRFGVVLQELLKHTEASTALIIDKGGFLITYQGNADAFDLTTIAALASGAYMANQTIANLVHETNFNSVYQQGEKYSIYATCCGDETLLVVIFEANQSVGVVKYFAEPAVEKITAQLKVAHERDPGNGIDLSILNVADTSGVFKKKRERQKRGA